MQYASSATALATRPAQHEVWQHEKRPKASRRPTKSQTFLEYLENEWLPHAETKVKPSTFVSLEGHVRLHIGPDIGDIPVERLTRDDLAGFYSRLLHKRATNRQHNLSRASIQRVHATIHSALEELVLSGRLNANPAHGLRTRRRKWENHEFRIWTPQELEFFLSQVKSDSLFPMWRLLAWTGMRRGEVVGLKWTDFRPEGKTITVRRAVSLVAGKRYVSTPKSAQARSLALDGETTTVLRRHALAVARRQPLDRVSPSRPSEWMFPGKADGPLDPALVSRRFKQLTRDISLPDIRLHDLRHTHASHLILSGANIKAVQERLGHADIVLTLNIYSHLLPTTQEESLRALVRFYR